MGIKYILLKEVNFKQPSYQTIATGRVYYRRAGNVKWSGRVWLLGPIRDVGASGPNTEA